MGSSSSTFPTYEPGGPTTVLSSHGRTNRWIWPGKPYRGEEEQTPCLLGLRHVARDEMCSCASTRRGRAWRVSCGASASGTCRGEAADRGSRCGWTVCASPWTDARQLRRTDLRQVVAPTRVRPLAPTRVSPLHRPAIVPRTDLR